MKATQYFVGISILTLFACSTAIVASAPPVWVAGIGALILGRGIIGANLEQDSSLLQHFDDNQTKPNSH